MKTVLLYSGGMDSWLIDKIYKPDIKLFIDIATNSSNGELNKLPPDVIVVPFRDLGQFERKETDFILPLRNLYFIAIASNFGDKILLGSNKTDVILDKTETFIEKATDLLNYMWLPQKWTKGKTITIEIPGRKYTKSDLLNIYIQNGGTWQEAYENTFSCFTPKNNKECHNCRACFLKLMAFIDNKCDIPKNILITYKDYIKSILFSSDSKWPDRLYSKKDYQHLLDLIEGEK